MDRPPAEPSSAAEGQAEHPSSDDLPVRLAARLRHLFDALERSGERWCLLRPAVTLLQSEGDIDLLVEPASLDHVRELVVGEGFVSLPMRTRDLHAVDYDRQCDRFLWLHVQTAVRLGTQLLPADTVLDAVKHDPLPQPADEWLFWILILHDILDKGEIPQRHRSELARWANSAGRPPPPVSAITHAHGLDPGQLVSLVRGGEWTQARGLAGNRVRPARPLRERLAAAADRVASLWTWRGVSVAIMGPDGAGKTTLVNGLRDALPFPTRVLYMGLTGGRLPRADALRVPGLVLAARVALLWVRYGVGLYHRSRARIVLFERYTLDGRVPSGIQLRALARLSRRVQAAVVPRPQLVLLLDAPGATMHSRKGEYVPAQLEEWRHAYRKLRIRGDVQVLDAEWPADAVRREAKARIWQCYVKRWQRSS